MIFAVHLLTFNQVFLNQALDIPDTALKSVTSSGVKCRSSARFATALETGWLLRCDRAIMLEIADWDSVFPFWTASRIDILDCPTLANSIYIWAFRPLMLWKIQYLDHLRLQTAARTCKCERDWMTVEVLGVLWVSWARLLWLPNRRQGPSSPWIVSRTGSEKLWCNWWFAWKAISKGI